MLTKAGCVVNELTPVGRKLDICWRGLQVFVSLSAVHKPMSRSAPDGRVGVSLAISICAPVSAVAVLLLTTKTFSKK
jgi:hypothetical protein